MTKQERHIVALDIGSTKTCALVGELDELGGVRFAALGAAESKGWRKGQIVNLDLAVSSIRRAVEEAETIVGVPIESAVVGVAGVHVRGVNSRGGITIGARPRAGRLCRCSSPTIRARNWQTKAWLRADHGASARRLRPA